MNPTTPPSLPPAMDPHQMNDATPEWEAITICEGKYTVRVHSSGRMEALRYGEPWREMTGDGLVMALFHEIQALRAHAPTAPLPTVAPHLAGLCERLEAVKYVLTANHPRYGEAVTQAIAALTQLAGEVERLKAVRKTGMSEADYQFREEEMRQKLAASELDADALAGAIESVLARPNYASGQAAKQALEQHRARGAAGGKT